MLHCCINSTISMNHGHFGSIILYLLSWGVNLHACFNKNIHGLTMKNCGKVISKRGQRSRSILEDQQSDLDHAKDQDQWNCDSEAKIREQVQSAVKTMRRSSYLVSQHYRSCLWLMPPNACFQDMGGMERRSTYARAPASTEWWLTDKRERNISVRSAYLPFIYRCKSILCGVQTSPVYSFSSTLRTGTATLQVIWYPASQHQLHHARLLSVSCSLHIKWLVSQLYNVSHGQCVKFVSL